MAGVSDWHKQQRKKELKKNKDARLAARNERVLVEKSIPGLRNEIEKLEGSLKHQPNHGTQMKVDRLKKELKLLLEHEEKNKKSKPVAGTGSVRALPPPSVHEPLPDPRVSIYFDATMNPFGEPPPGRPRLFHRRGGGTTLTLREACVPGEEDECDSVLSPPPPDTTVEKTKDAKTTKRGEKDIPISPRAREGRQRSEKPPPINNVKRSSATKKSVVDPAHPIMSTEPKPVPVLPQASASVKRSKKLSVDIWASTVELEYDNDSWEYRDLVANAVQGPFATQQMQGWINAGHFPAHTLARKVNTDEWRKICQIKELWNSNLDENKKKRKKSPAARDDESQGDVQKRIAALRQQQSLAATVLPDPDTVQGRIAALRGSALPAADLLMDDDDAQRRIAALRKSPPSVDDDVQSRFARKRAGEVEDNSTINDAPIDSQEPPQGVQPEEVRAQTQILASGLPVPPPPLPPHAALSRSPAAEMPSYPAPAMPSMPMPPPPTPWGRSDDDDLHSYPTNVESSLPAYPLLPSTMEDDDNFIVAPYPLPALEDDSGLEAIAPYPTDNFTDDFAPDPMSFVDDDSRPPAQPEVNDNLPRPGLKKAKVDKSLVAFLPTALQRKRAQ